MKKLVLLVYVIYAAFVPLVIYEINDQDINADFWLWLIAFYIGVPALIYIAYLAYKLKKGANSSTGTIPSKGSTASRENSWSLVEFAKLHGQMQIQRDYNEDSGKYSLNLCRFINTNGEIIVANVAHVLWNYTVDDIEKNKDNLSIIVLESGAYCLCLNWEDVPF